jgi:7-cyano-7-deazaguanine synthase
MRKVLILSSGGLDSTTVTYWLRERGEAIVPVFFDYGQHCAEKEWTTLQEVLPTSGVEEPRRINISDIFHGSSSRLISEADLWTEAVNPDDLYIPYRTLLFFSAAAAIAQTCGVTEVYSGFIKSNHAKELDCSVAFLNSLGALSERVGPVRFDAPFREKTKREVVEIAKRLNVPIGRTFSCQVFSEVPCGACPNCVDRLEALIEAGLHG